MAQKFRTRQQGFATRLNVKANAQRNERVFVPRGQDAGKNHSTKVANKLFESVTKLKCLGTTQTNENGMHEEVKKHSRSGECQFVLYMT